MIEFKNVSKYYGEKDNIITIFKDFNFLINSGEFISIVGPSGSGKSTFLNIISGIDRDFTGDVFINNTIINHLNDDSITEFRGKNISYIFQNFKLIKNLTVKENIDLIIQLNKLERNYSTDEILDIVGLSNKKNTYVFNLSGGESQRVAIARAFVGKTSLLLADEPTGSLDINNKNIIINLILELHKKVNNTVILITHDNELASITKNNYKISNGILQKI